MKNLKHFFYIVLCCLCQLGFANHVSLREKIGQMLLIGFEGKHIQTDSILAKTITENNIGGVILFDYDSRNKQFDYNISDPTQVAELNKELQTIVARGNKTYHRPNLPLLISVDYEGGHVNRLKEAYGFPATLSAQEMGQMSTKEVHHRATKMAKTLRRSGFNLDFAPVTDVNINPENPIIGKRERSFSSDPYQVTRYANAFSIPLLKQKIQCAYKHFPGHGSSMHDSHKDLVDVSDSWQKRELLPYEKLLAQKQHCGVIMTAHIINRKLDPSGLPATLSRHVLTDLLRHHLHFKGVIITDDLQMNAIANYYGLDSALTLAINAGADMLTFANQVEDIPNPKVIIDTIEQKVIEGEISETRINEAYHHILQLKKRL